ncbi:hypothetical protein [Pseudomonas viridiflava]|uniref:hypothetical protein n=1 Tax=Pseudomonas viridiflava TaxID=33069 RepID=UPI000F063D90|nr:hypothetical protein [Pseudomonas viridiflava]
MKKWLVVLVFFLALGIWFSAIFFVPWLTDYSLERQGCVDITLPKCQAVISSYGATGDIFGVTTSLFTGLALFAVAITLWADVTSRKDSRKPFLITQLDSDSLVLSGPVVKGAKSIMFDAEVTLANQTGEAALNISLAGHLAHSEKLIKLPVKNLSSPIIGEKTETIKLQVVIVGDVYDRFLAELSGGQAIEFATTVSYQSLEGVKWSTSVVYEIQCIAPIQRQRLNSARVDNADFEQQWENNAAVALSASAKGGSWKHKKISG